MPRKTKCKEDHVLYQLSRLGAKGPLVQKALWNLQREFIKKFEAMDTQLESFADATREVERNYEELLEAKDEEIDELKGRVLELEMQLDTAVANQAPPPEDPDKRKACTIAIFDGILFAIENWSVDGDTAPDFTLACQAVLYPLVYNKVMQGYEAYYLESMPEQAAEVVKHGREHIKSIRSMTTSGLSDPAVWNEYMPLIHDWLVNSALPLLYGAEDPDWKVDSPLTQEEIMIWRDQPASRALQFPMVFDAMDLMSRHGDSIRDTTGLPEFTRQTIDTRLEAN